MSTNTDRKEVTELEYSKTPKFYGANTPLQTIDDSGAIIFSFVNGLKIATGTHVREIIKEYAGLPFYIDAINGYPKIKVLDAYLCISEKHLDQSPRF